jgi:hypothetical protein
MNFEKIFPGLNDFFDQLPLLGKVNLGFFTLLDIFALFGAMHLVGMALIGGCSILMNVRFWGAGITAETPAQVEKGLRRWLWLGIGLAIFSGLIMGALTSSKLYGSAAFFSKIMALIAAVVFSFGVTNSIAKSDGQVSRNALIASVVAMVFWAISLLVFVSTEVVNVGLFHVITACYGIVLIFGSRLNRIIAVTAYAVLFGGVFVIYWIAGFNSYDQIYLDISMWAMIIGLVVVLALIFLELREKDRDDSATPVARLNEVISFLTWVTVAAGGRSIGFSP